MDRCALAHQYHQQGYSCAQSVAGAFADLTDWTPEQLFAATGAFGGGVGGSHEELCGAVSGGLLVLGLLYPHTQAENRDAKKKIFGLAKQFRQRFLTPSVTPAAATCCAPGAASAKKRPLRPGWVSPPTVTSW